MFDLLLYVLLRCRCRSVQHGPSVSVVNSKTGLSIRQLHMYHGNCDQIECRFKSHSFLFHQSSHLTSTHLKTQYIKYPHIYLNLLFDYNKQSFYSVFQIIKSIVFTHITLCKIAIVISMWQFCICLEIIILKNQILK